MKRGGGGGGGAVVVVVGGGGRGGGGTNGIGGGGAILSLSFGPLLAILLDFKPKPCSPRPSRQRRSVLGMVRKSSETRRGHPP